MKSLKFLAGAVLFVISVAANANGLKVFGPEFCAPNTAGACINFHYKNIKDAKTLTGEYKYPRGRRAYEECVKNGDTSDGGFAYCSMVFHREEQTPSQRADMCKRLTRGKYLKTISDAYAMSLYDAVWGCK